jgi:hypothetical protein
MHWLAWETLTEAAGQPVSDDLVAAAPAAAQP